jgi:hypothetical protein
MRFFFVIDTTGVRLLLFMIRIPTLRHMNMNEYINSSLPGRYRYLLVHSSALLCESTISDMASGMGSAE